MAETYTLDGLMAAARVAEEKSAKVQRTTKDRDALTRRIGKEQAEADQAQKDYEAYKAAVEAALKKGK